MTAPQTASALVGTGPGLASPRLDGSEGRPEASGPQGRPGTRPMVMQSDGAEKPGGDGPHAGSLATLHCPGNG